MRWARALRYVAVTGTSVTLLTAPAAAKTVLTVMDWKLNETKATQAWFQQVKEKFEREHPGVEVQYVTAPWGNEYRDKILTGVAAGSAPDVVSLSIVWARDLFEKGALLPLNNFIKKTPELAPERFVPPTQWYNQKDGVIFGITNAMDESAVLYNLDFFEEAGLDTDPMAIATWDQFLDAARKLTKVGPDGKVSRYGYNGFGLEVYNSWLVSNGGSFYADRALNKAGFNSPQAIETAQFLHDLLNVYRVIGGSLAGRTAAMEHGGNWSPYFLQQSAPDLRFNLTSYPKGPSGHDRGTTVWGNMMAIPASSKNAELAWEFISYYCGLQGNIDMFKALNYVNSPRLDFYRSQVWLEAQRRFIWMPMIPRVAMVGGVYPFRRYTELTGQIWGPLLEPALRGQKPIRSSFEEAERLYNQILAQ